MDIKIRTHKHDINTINLIARSYHINDKLIISSAVKRIARYINSPSCSGIEHNYV